MEKNPLRMDAYSVTHLIKKTFPLALSAVFVAGIFVSIGIALAEESNVSVTAPASGNFWRGTQDIIWTDVSVAPPYDVFYSSDFNVFQNLISNVNDTTTDWDTTTVADETYQVKVKNASDEFGVSEVFTIDNTPPTTTLGLSDGTLGLNDWYIVSPTITLSCGDALSGCSDTFYSWDGVATTTYEGPFAATEGEHTLFFYSEDEAEDKDEIHNVEETQTESFKVDTVPPAVDFYTLDGVEENAFFNPDAPDSVEIIIVATEPVEYNRIKILDDELAEVKFFMQVGFFEATTTRSWDDAGEIADGVYTLQVNIEDIAGNVVNDLDLTPHTITVDTQTPTVSTLSAPVADAVYKTGSPIPITFTPSDPLPGTPLTCGYRVGEEPIVEFGSCTGEDEFSNFVNENNLTDGRNNIVGVVTDAAGNSVESVSVSIVFDNNNTLTVDDNGIAFADFDNIQEAINKASSNDTIQVAEGTYTEPIQTLAACGNEPASFCIDKSLTLRGDLGDASAGPGSNAPVLDGASLGNGSAIALLRGSAISNVTIEGFVIRNYANPVGQGGVGSGVIAWNTDSSDIIVRDNSFEDLGWNGVLVGSDNDTVQSGWIVQNNVIDNAAYAGIELTNVTDSTVSSNVITVSNGNWDAGDSGVGIEVAVRAHSSVVIAGTNVVVQNNQLSVGGPDARAAINILSRAYNNAVAAATLSGVTVSGNTITEVEPRGIFVVAETRNAGATAAVNNLNITINTINGSPDNIVIRDFMNGNGTPTHSDISITGNDIINSTGGASGIHILEGTSADGITVNNNIITGNIGFGVNNEGNGVLNAVDNWWGVNGPTHASNTFNVDAQGDTVSNNVSFVPWLDAPAPGGASFAPVTTDLPVGSYASIGAGVNAVTTDGTVNAVAGIFTESGILADTSNTSITGSIGTIVRAPEGCPSESPSTVFHLHADDVTLSGFEINANGCDNGIHIGDLSEIQVSGVAVSGNKVYGADHGITLSWGSSNDSNFPNVVSGNDVHDNGIGVLIDSSWYNIVDDNFIHDNIEGILLGTCVQQGGCGFAASHDNLIINNTIINNSGGEGTGIVIDASGIGSDNKANFNTIIGNGVGVQNFSGTDFDAKRNWWGSPTGPSNVENPGGSGEPVSDFVIFSPFCTNEDCTTLGSIGPLDAFLLFLDPTTVVIPGVSTVSVKAVDAEEIALVNNNTIQVTLIADGGAFFGANLLTLTGGEAETTVSNNDPGTVNVTAMEVGGAHAATGQVEFVGAPATGIVLDDVVLPFFAEANDTYLSGWHYIFRVTVNNTNETQMFVKFSDWINTVVPEATVATLGNTRLLLNAGAGVGITEADIENGFSLGNEYENQTPTVIDIDGIDNNLDRAGRQIQFDVFVKLPVDTVPGFYETVFSLLTETPIE